MSLQLSSQQPFLPQSAPDSTQDGAPPPNQLPGSGASDPSDQRPSTGRRPEIQVQFIKYKKDPDTPGRFIRPALEHVFPNRRTWKEDRGRDRVAYMKIDMVPAPCGTAWRSRFQVIFRMPNGQAVVPQPDFHRQSDWVPDYAWLSLGGYEPWRVMHGIFYNSQPEDSWSSSTTNVPPIGVQYPQQMGIQQMAHQLTQTGYQPPVDQPLVDQPLVDQPPINQPPVNQPFVYQPPVNQPLLDQPLLDQPLLDQPLVDQPPINQPPVDQPPVDQPLVDQPLVVQTQLAVQDQGVTLDYAPLMSGSLGDFDYLQELGRDFFPENHVELN
jgi:hypothetical protein